MRSGNLAVVVPVDQTQNADSLKTHVWGVVTDLLTKYLGTYYGSFFPVQKAWDSEIKNAYGVVLGIDDPLNFLNLLAEAQKKQQNAMAFHMGFLFKEIEKADTGEHVIPIFINSENEQVLFHLAWKVLAEGGIVLPDYGIYYTQQKKAFISDAEEQHIISHVADYAICVVRVVELEANHA